MQTVVPVSERRACRGLAQPRRTQRRPARVPRDEPALIARLIALARRFGRYGSRRITALLRAEGWRVNHKRVERRWRQEGGCGCPAKPRTSGGSGPPLAPARVAGRSGRTTSGPTTASTSGRRTGGPGASWASWLRIELSVWRQNPVFGGFLRASGI